MCFRVREFRGLGFGDFRVTGLMRHEDDGGADGLLSSPSSSLLAANIMIHDDVSCHGQTYRHNPFLFALIRLQRLED